MPNQVEKGYGAMASVQHQGPKHNLLTHLPAFESTDAAAAELEIELNQSFVVAINAADWPKAAELLNAFSRRDIQDRVAKCSAAEILKLHDAAINHPEVGPFSDVAELTIGRRRLARPMTSTECVKGGAPSVPAGSVVAMRRASM